MVEVPPQLPARAQPGLSLCRQGGAAGGQAFASRALPLPLCQAGISGTAVGPAGRAGSPATASSPACTCLRRAPAPPPCRELPGQPGCPTGCGVAEVSWLLPVPGLTRGWVWPRWRSLCSENESPVFRVLKGLVVFWGLTQGDRRCPGASPGRGLPLRPLPAAQPCPGASSGTGGAASPPASPRPASERPRRCGICRGRQPRCSLRLFLWDNRVCRSHR